MFCADVIVVADEVSICLHIPDSPQIIIRVSSLLFLSEVHCVGGPGPEPETVYKCVGRGQSSHLTRANAAIRTNGADTIISHYPDPAPGSH